MTNTQLIEELQKQLVGEKWSMQGVYQLLKDYKASGGQKDTVQELVERLATSFSDNETLQDRAYDVLDIITGWCSPALCVWD